jgi:hypothetical protein
MKESLVLIAEARYVIELEAIVCPVKNVEHKSSGPPGINNPRIQHGGIIYERFMV